MPDQSSATVHYETPTPDTDALMAGEPHGERFESMAWMDQYDKLMAHARRLEQERDAARREAFVLRCNAPSETRERTPADYAIEHGEHLAKAAESFLASYNRVAQMELDADNPPELHDHEAAVESRGDAYKDLTSAIYEFRKRAERASVARTETAPRKSDENDLRPYSPWMKNAKPEEL